MTLPHFKRHRRLRQMASGRNLLRETILTPHDFVLPLFIRHGKDQKVAIKSMPGQVQLTIDHLPKEIADIKSRNIPAVILFGIPAFKDASGSSALLDDGVIQQAIATIKDIAPDLTVITDLCCCEYTDHGHCGVLHETSLGQQDVDNDATLTLLTEQALSHAQAGADIIAPSGMMDGMVTSIRQTLDEHQFNNIAILSYAAKYCSSLYGPFRDAAESTPQFGDRKTYQMDPANRAEALREVMSDVEEGADMLMVKPALSYLDVIADVKQHYPEIPLCAYQVSGEYAMIKAAANAGWLDEQRVAHETVLSIKRAGADFIITYFAKELATLVG